MIASVLLSLGTVCVVPSAAGSQDSLQALYEQGQTWPEFYGGIVRRAEMWRTNYAKGAVETDALMRARAVAGTWRILVIAVDGCSDSANTIPYLASLADSAEGKITFRIVDPARGRGIMEAHRTRDGRAATPTLILLDSQGHEVGCWVERPSELAGWVERERSGLSDAEVLRQKFAWYDTDAGRSTVREVLDMIERAAPGAECGGGA